ncbi:hypothetical protein DFJ73DRAFT_665935 [Zopfochytrium polystomum]|nr:hypothetical protein DFJ73DRAFT_665935 [Zopfochytrium polystomum]
MSSEHLTAPPSEREAETSIDDPATSINDLITPPFTIPSIVSTICDFLEPPQRFALATLHQLKTVQAGALTAVLSSAAAAATQTTSMSAGTSASSELAANWFANTDRLALVRDRGGNAGRRFLTASLRRAVFLASCRGDVEALRWWVGGGGEKAADVEDGTNKDFGSPGSRLYIDLEALYHACMNGHVEVLRWWRGSFPDAAVLVESRAVDAASMFGRVDVLEWWKTIAVGGADPNAADAGAHGPGESSSSRPSPRSAPPPLAYSASTMDSPLTPVSALQWWRDSELPLRYTASAMDHASGFGQLEKLEWWRGSGLDLRYSILSMDGASSNGHVAVLQWWLDSGLELKFTYRSIDWASKRGNVAVLEWWKQSGLEFAYTHSAVDGAAESGRTNVLDWWIGSGFDLKYTAHAVDNASRCGRLDVLEWWRENGLDWKYTDNALSWARQNGHNDVVAWWDEFSNPQPKPKEGLSLS